MKLYFDIFTISYSFKTDNSFLFLKLPKKLIQFFFSNFGALSNKKIGIKFQHIFLQFVSTIVVWQYNNWSLTQEKSSHYYTS